MIYIICLFFRLDKIPLTLPQHLQPNGETQTFILGVEDPVLDRPELLQLPMYDYWKEKHQRPELHIHTCLPIPIMSSNPTSS